MKKAILFLMITLFGVSLTSCKPVNSSSQVAEQTYKVSYVENENCSIVLSKSEAKVNDIISVEVKSIKEGYEVHKITCNGMKIDENSFVMPREDVVVEVFLIDLENGPYALEVMKSEFAKISTSKETYSYGENVTINYTTKGDYVLDKFLVNGEAIKGNTFKMPKGNVVIEGTFKKAIEDTPWQLAIESGGNIGRSYWYFDYGETTLNINVKVEDRIICGYQYAEHSGFQDNVEVVLTPKTIVPGWAVNKSYKFLVSCEGDCTVNVATSPTMWSDFWNYTGQDFGYTVDLRSMDKNDGYNGYEVNMYVSYSLFGLTKEQAIGNLSACLSMRNVNAYGASVWGFYAGNGNWENCSSHPLITDDGKLLERS